MTIVLLVLCVLVAVLVAVAVRVGLARRAGLPTPEGVLLEGSTWLVAGLVFAVLAAGVLRTTGDDPEPREAADSRRPPAQTVATTDEQPPTAGCAAAPALEKPVAPLTLEPVAAAREQQVRAHYAGAADVAARQLAGANAAGELVALCPAAGTSPAVAIAQALRQTKAADPALARARLQPGETRIGETPVFTRRDQASGAYVAAWEGAAGVIYLLRDSTEASATAVLGTLVPALA